MNRPTEPRPMRWAPTRTALTALLCTVLLAHGHAAAPDDAQRQRIREAVQRATGVLPDSVEPTSALPGYYEVRAKGAVAYVDAQARHLVKGQVIDLATGENLTLSRAPGAPARIDVAALPLADAITTVAGKGQRHLYVFVDPNCTFCRSLEPELVALQNVSVHRFVMPVLGPGSEGVARKAWCAADRAAAWRRATAAQALPAEAASCDSAALQRNVALGKALGVSATPTLVFANGERVVAVMRSAEIEARLAGKASLAAQP